MPEVSIVIPFFKKKKYIIKTIKSVLSQSYKNFEVLIIYDDEENSDFFFLKHVKNLDKRIFLFKNKVIRIFTFNEKYLVNIYYKLLYYISTLNQHIMEDDQNYNSYQLKYWKI